MNWRVKEKKERHGGISRVGVLVCLAGLSGCALDVPVYIPETSTVLFETEEGNFEVELYRQAAPITTANFLRYIAEEMYEGGEFYSATQYSSGDGEPGGYIQGNIPAKNALYKHLPISLESTDLTGLEHEDGTISMARPPETGATTVFFICIGDQPQFDFGGDGHSDGQGFAAFGRVTAGMDVVRRIHARGSASGEMRDPVEIYQIRQLRTR